MFFFAANTISSVIGNSCIMCIFSILTYSFSFFTLSNRWARSVVGSGMKVTPAGFYLQLHQLYGSNPTMDQSGDAGMGLKSMRSKMVVHQMLTIRTRGRNFHGSRDFLTCLSAAGIKKKSPVAE